MWDKIMLRKRYIIECINELLKNKANLVHSRHRSIHNFIMNLCSALTAYCFFDNKPEALPVYVEKSRQLELFAYWPYPELEYNLHNFYIFPFFFLLISNKTINFAPVMQNTVIIIQGISVAQGKCDFPASFNTLYLLGSDILLTHTHTHTHTHTPNRQFFPVRIRARKERLKHILQRLSVRIALAVFSCIFQPNIRS